MRTLMLIVFFFGSWSRVFAHNTPHLKLHINKKYLRFDICSQLNQFWSKTCTSIFLHTALYIYISLQQKQLELGDKMDLSSYLLKPVQRMGKYALLLKQLLKECPETELEYPELKVERFFKCIFLHRRQALYIQLVNKCDWTAITGSQK